MHYSAQATNITKIRGKRGNSCTPEVGTPEYIGETFIFNFGDSERNDTTVLFFFSIFFLLHPSQTNNMKEYVST